MHDVVDPRRIDVNVPRLPVPAYPKRSHELLGQDFAGTNMLEQFLLLFHPKASLLANAVLLAATGWGAQLSLPTVRLHEGSIGHQLPQSE
jgi:hypothetical protein